MSPKSFKSISKEGGNTAVTQSNEEITPQADLAFSDLFEGKRMLDGVNEGVPVIVLVAVTLGDTEPLGERDTSFFVALGVTAPVAVVVGVLAIDILGLQVADSAAFGSNVELELIDADGEEKLVGEMIADEVTVFDTASEIVGESNWVKLVDAVELPVGDAVNKADEIPVDGTVSETVGDSD